MIGTRLGNRYEVLREIGRGGMGVVYAARDPMLDREVAVKLLAPAALTPESEARFRAEARIVAAMDHPAIVSVYDVGEHDGALFLVLPLVKGANLRRFLEQKLLTDADIVEIGIQVADALEHSHSLGVVHRDIKPENIIVARDGSGPPRVRLTDFGLALSAQQQRQTRSGSIVGSMSYLTPEQISRRDIDARSDLYSLGTVLFECFTGSLPFDAHFPAILWSIEHDAPRQLLALRPDLPPPLAALIMSCLAKSPSDRPQSASEIVNTLRSIDLQSTTANERLPMHQRAAAPIPSVMEAPTVGREEPLRLVRNRLDRAIDGDGQLMVIGGAAGVGKTRLIEELRREAQHRNVRVLGGRFSDTGVPYQAYCEAIEEYFVKSSAGDVTPLADLARDLAALFPSLSDVAALRALLPASEPPHAPTDRTGIFEQLSRAFVRLAGGRPLLLVLEETHDADVSLEALQFLFRRFRPHPIMVVATYRSDDAGKGHPVRTLIQNLRGDPNFVPLDLAPLSFEATHELIVHLLRSRHVDDQVIARIWESAEGNPLFTMELVKAMLESGMIFMAAGVWQLSRRREWEELPATIQETVARRIERLPEQDRRLLSTASILGRRFDLADLELLLDDSVDLDATVQTLLDSGIINEEREARGDVYSFAGAAMRDVLYTSLPRRRRRTLHLRYATELERRSSRSDRVVPELLHHFANADAREKVFEYGLPLAQRYLANVSAEDAMRIARIVLDMVDEESRDERLVAGEAKCIIAAAQRILGHTDAALQSASEAFALFEGERVAAAAGAARIAAETAWERRRLDEARHWVERGIVAGRAAGDRDDLRKLLSLSATIANVRGDHATAQQRLEEAEALGPAETESGSRSSGPVPGVLHIALNSDLMTLDPALSITIAQAEIMPEIFDTLTRATDAARIEPWLAESLEAADGGLRYDVRLREGVTFHDGSPVTSADVRYSFERLLRSETGVRRAVLSAIAGASRVLAGSGEALEGFQIRSELEFSILLEKPVAFFPALLTNTATSIIPAHSTPSANSWRDGCLGSGPFRLVRFEPGNRVELEANPFYWRRGLPRCEKLVFSLGVMPDEMRDGFLRGRYSVVRDLYPADVEALRSDPRYAPNYREVPLLSTYYLAINGHRGPLTDEALRRELVKGIDVDDLVTRHVGREGIRALSFTPPGLLGHDPEGTVVETDESTSRISPEPLAHLTAMLNSVYQGPYAGFAQELLARLEVHGFPVRVIDSRSENFSNQAASLATADLLLTRWIADYPDGHDFVALFHTRTGIMGKVCGRDDVDALIERGEVELDPALRHEIYREIFAILRRHTLVLPLFHEQAYRFARPDVDGFELSFTAPTVAYEKLAIRM